MKRPKRFPTLTPAKDLLRSALSQRGIRSRCPDGHRYVYVLQGYGEARKVGIAVDLATRFLLDSYVMAAPPRRPRALKHLWLLQDELAVATEAAVLDCLCPFMMRSAPSVRTEWISSTDEWVAALVDRRCGNVAEQRWSGDFDLRPFMERLYDNRYIRLMNRIRHQAYMDAREEL